ncbi:MAG: glycoside hydrolase family 16 protein [Acidobacteriota bacterium]
MMTRRLQIVLTSVLALQLSALCPMKATALQFSGYEWEVKTGDGLGPGPNNWSASNVSVDANGYLHLKITQMNGKWYSASVKMTQSLGFGKYQFWVIGAIDTLDKNVVLGMFNYSGPDGTNEIDIEVARWGNATGTNLSYAVYPEEDGFDHTSKKLSFTLTGTYTTHRFTWESTGVLFQGQHGHYNDSTNEFARWSFYPEDSSELVPQDPMPVRLNLWLYQGNPPSNGQPVEVVIRSFTYTPL